jgi:hypothetical protein
VSDGLLSINVALHDAILVDTNGSEQVESALVAGVDTVENKAHNNLLPSRTTLVPELGFLEVDNVTNVLHDTVQGTCSEDLVFIVVGDGNQQLSVTVVHGRAQIVTVLQSEVIGITGCGSVWKLSDVDSRMKCDFVLHLHRM